MPPGHPGLSLTDLDLVPGSEPVHGWTSDEER